MPQVGGLCKNDKWWTATQHIVQQFAHGIPIYVLIDANAKTGHCQPPMVLAHDDVASVNTDFFRAFLQVNALCLPSTSEAHCSVLTDFDSGTCFDDHRAVGVQLSWVNIIAADIQKPKSFKAHDRSAIASHCHEIDLKNIAVNSWHDDIETQVQAFNDRVLTSLHRTCPSRPQGKRKQ